MKASLNRETLAIALEHVRHTADGRFAQGLENAWLHAQPGFMEITAHNRHQTVTHTIPALVEAEGRAAVPAAFLCEVAKSLNGSGLVDLEWDGEINRLRITCGHSVSNIAGTAPEARPETARHVLEGSAVTLDPQAFHAAMRAVFPAIAKTDDRPTLHNMLFQADGDRFRTAAADGFRMIMDGGDLPAPAPEPVEALIPAKAVDDLTRLLLRCREPLETIMSAEDHRITFWCDEPDGRYGTSYTTVLTPGQFPDVDRLVPQEWASRLKLPAEDVARDLKGLRSLASQSSNVIRFTMDAAAGGELRMKSAAPDVGTVEVFIPVEDRQGGAPRIAFSHAFIQDIAAAIPATGTLIMETGEPGAPGVFRDARRDSYLSVVMPMAVLWDDDAPAAAAEPAEDRPDTAHPDTADAVPPPAVDVVAETPTEAQADTTVVDAAAAEEPAVPAEAAEPALDPAPEPPADAGNELPAEDMSAAEADPAVEIQEPATDGPAAQDPDYAEFSLADEAPEQPEALPADAVPEHVEAGPAAEFEEPAEAIAGLDEPVCSPAAPPPDGAGIIAANGHAGTFDPDHEPLPDARQPEEAYDPAPDAPNGVEPEDGPAEVAAEIAAPRRRGRPRRQPAEAAAA